MTTPFEAENLFLSVVQVAKRYGVSTDSIWRWTKQGNFPAAVRVGPNCTRWRLADLNEYDQQLQACCVMSASWALAA
ncbi:helix-turn-helix domain-containing protein [Paracoccus sp. CPCC 101403]|uniref:Helix-turn-helix domain-containing protein n=1 Tax=Paracoccus broussonetiae TaxID=3075834 RepID=A0ABU3EJD4_9RHOB|nr:helix-turn-helix domain-containing protein [Paracoccus sp. CPCC 101403]MDT1064362.1 helix-turn-helix domain-containing protein [Paracoccus sp. CPCC 101403]